MKKNGRVFRSEYLLMLIAALFWALGHPFGKIALREVHPFQLGAFNLIAGFFSLLIFLAVTRRLKELFKLPFRDLLSSLFLGVFGFFLYQILTFSALSRIPASMNAVLISTNVVFILIFSAIFLKEKIQLYKIAGIVLAFAGVLFVTFNTGFSAGPNVNLLGCIFSICAVISFTLYSIFGKHVLSRNDPLIVSTLAIFSGAVLLTLMTLFTEGFQTLSGVGAQTWVIMIMLGVTMIGTSYPLYFTCLKRMPASHVSIYIYMTPVFAVILSLVILKERFSWPFWLGTVLVLSGIVISSYFTGKSANTDTGKPAGADG
jgi:drug/metabolite transporter (DMT)-like permease